MNPLNALEKMGQSIWLDFIDRTLITSGKLQRLIEEEGVSGITSNPSIFEKAIAGTKEYDSVIGQTLAQGDRSALSIYEELAIQDIRAAADILLPIYRKLSTKDGYVSLEVSPYLAADTQGTINEARRLWKAVSRPNVMIKVPGTAQGIPAIRQLVEDGINVNITLLFSVEVYEQVAEAYLSGLEARQARGESLSEITSVASFFVSRIDAVVDSLLRDRLRRSEIGSEARLAGLLGKVAIANAKVAYQVYQKLHSSSRWQALENHGAKPQRLLWASTSTKNPSYSDVMYVEQLIGPETINTVPLATLLAFKDHGKAGETLTQEGDAAQSILTGLKSVGIDLKSVTDKLLVDGIAKFRTPFDQLLRALETKRVNHLGPRLNSLSYRIPESLQDSIKRELDDWAKAKKLRREWRGDSSVWSGSGEGKWLGWLSAPSQELAKAKGLVGFASEIRDAGFQDVVLLGMGGSSLGAEVLAKSFESHGVRSGFPKLHILDSTDPAQIQELERQISKDHTLYIVSSKSGTTLEPNIFFDYFFDRIKTQVGARDAGKRFVAITDPGTALEAKAKELGFRKVYYGEPTIGGRYSVLSNFGMVPAALMGIDIEKLLEQTLIMARSCSADVPPLINPGVVLGAVLGVLGNQGRDKVTLVCSDEISGFGSWLEQLLAESTGKQGKGLIPIDREALSPPDVYGSDRIFAYLRLTSADNSKLDQEVEALARAGHPVVRIEVSDLYNLGQEFYRWEAAVAIAGSILGINPFDQPDVEASKAATRTLTAQFEADGSLPAETPIFQNEEVQIFGDGQGDAELKRHLPANPRFSDFIRGHIDRVNGGDYFAILAYLPMNKQGDSALQDMRTKILRAKKVATCVEFGPRFLHSTGQAYKGGPNTGVFLQITSDDVSDLAVPGHRYTFGVVKAAEARGDFRVLSERGRRAMRIHFRRGPAAGLKALQEEVDKVVS
jgi:transaldolase/glucose-6-phosphate isomerase